MMEFLKLLTYEMKKFWRIHAVLLAIVFFGGTLAYVVELQIRMKTAEATALREAAGDIGLWLRMNDSLYTLGPNMHTLWTYIPIFLGAAFIVGLAFFIWYREWFGKNTTIYRTLMLPVSRANIFLAKFFTIVIFTFSLVAMEIITIFTQLQLYKKLIFPEMLSLVEPFRLTVLGVIAEPTVFNVVIPVNPFSFITLYVGGMIILLVLFHLILLERAYRWKGILIGVGYVATLIAGFFAFVAVQQYLFNDEIVVVMLVTLLFICTFSFGWSVRILKRKISA